MSLRLELGEYCGTSVARRRVHGFLLTENRFAPGLKISVHQHSHPHFTIVLQGGFRETYGKNSIDCGKGSVLFVPAHAEHTDEVWPEGAHTLGVEISPAIVKRMHEHLSLLRDPSLLASETLQRLAKRLYTEFRSPDASSMIAMEALALEVLVTASRTQAASATNEPAWMLRLRHAIGERFAKALSVSALAAEAGVHESHLARAFQRHHGCTVTDYIRQIRLQAASRLLAGTDTPLAEIACEVGFCDQAHFCRAFKSAYGAPPGAYRKLHGRDSG